MDDLNSCSHSCSDTIVTTPYSTMANLRTIMDTTDTSCSSHPISIEQEIELVREDLIPKPLACGDYWYLISSRWIDAWKVHVCFNDTPNKKRRVSPATTVTLATEGITGHELKMDVEVTDGDEEEKGRIYGDGHCEGHSSVPSTVPLPHPGPIDNRCLLPPMKPSDNGPDFYSFPFVLSPHLQEEQDYLFLSPRVYKLLEGRYGSVTVDGTVINMTTQRAASTADIQQQQQQQHAVSFCRQVVGVGPSYTATSSGTIELYPMRLDVYCSTLAYPQPHCHVPASSRSHYCGCETGLMMSRQSTVRSVYDLLTSFVIDSDISTSNINGNINHTGVTNIRVWYRLIDETDDANNKTINEVVYEPSAKRGRKMVTSVCDVELTTTADDNNDSSSGSVSVSVSGSGSGSISGSGFSNSRISWRLVKVHHDALTLHQLCGDNLNVRADFLIEFGRKTAATICSTEVDNAITTRDSASTSTSTSAAALSNPFECSTALRALLQTSRTAAAVPNSSPAASPASGATSSPASTTTTTAGVAAAGAGTQYPRSVIVDSWKHSLAVGDEIDACDDSKAWYAAFVTAVVVDTETISSYSTSSTRTSYAKALRSGESHMHTLKSVTVHFRSWSDTFDKVINAADFRKLIRPLFTITPNWRRIKENNNNNNIVENEGDDDNLTPARRAVKGYAQGIAAGMEIELKYHGKWFKGVISHIGKKPSGVWVTVDVTINERMTAVTVEIESDELATHPTHVKMTGGSGGVSSSSSNSMAITPYAANYGSQNRNITSAASSSNSTGSSYNRYASTSSSYSPHRTGTPSARGAVGLQNLGNTCFMNSMLQCLSHTECLSRYFTSGYYKQEINTDNPLGHNGAVARSYGNLIRDYWNSDCRYSVLSPVDFKRTIAEFAPQFAGYQQHDSQELMQFVLDGLHEDLNRVIKKPYVEGVEAGDREDIEVARETWSKHVLRNDSHILDCCFGLLKSHVTCTNCKHHSVTFDAYSSLSLPLPINPNKTMKVVMFPLQSFDDYQGYGRAVSHSYGSGSITTSVLALQCEITITPDMTVGDVETLIKGYFDQYRRLLIESKVGGDAIVAGGTVESVAASKTAAVALPVEAVFARILNYNQVAVNAVNSSHGNDSSNNNDSSDMTVGHDSVAVGSNSSSADDLTEAYDRAVSISTPPSSSSTTTTTTPLTLTDETITAMDLATTTSSTAPIATSATEVQLYYAYHHSAYKTTGRCTTDNLAIKEFASQCRGNAYADVVLAYENRSSSNSSSDSSDSSSSSVGVVSGDDATATIISSDAMTVSSTAVAGVIEQLLIVSRNDQSLSSEIANNSSISSKHMLPDNRGMPTIQALHAQLRTQQLPPRLSSPLPSSVSPSSDDGSLDTDDATTSTTITPTPGATVATNTGVDTTAPATVSTSFAPVAVEFVDVEYNRVSPLVYNNNCSTTGSQVSNFRVVPNSLAQRVRLPRFITVTDLMEFMWLHSEQFVVDKSYLELGILPGVFDGNESVCGVRYIGGETPLYVYTERLQQLQQPPQYRHFLLPFQLWTCASGYYTGKQCLSTPSDDSSATVTSDNRCLSNAVIDLIQVLQPSDKGKRIRSTYIFNDPLNLAVYYSSLQWREFYNDSVKMVVEANGMYCLCDPDAGAGAAGTTVTVDTVMAETIGPVLPIAASVDIVDSAKMIPVSGLIKDDLLTVPVIAQAKERMANLALSASDSIDISENSTATSTSTSSSSSSACNLTIYNCLQKYSEWEQLPESETYYCSKCQQHCPPLKKLELFTTPDILIVQFKRFHYSPGTYFVHREKINDVVDFPVTGLDLRQYVKYKNNFTSNSSCDTTAGSNSDNSTASDCSPYIYDLYAVSEHGGGLGGGHYTAQCMNFSNQTWYDFNDSMVTEIKTTAVGVNEQGVVDPEAAAVREKELKSHVVTSQAYVLFYKRRHGHLRWGGIDVTQPTAPANAAIYAANSMDHVSSSGDDDSNSDKTTKAMTSSTTTMNAARTSSAANSRSLQSVFDGSSDLASFGFGFATNNNGVL